MKRSKFTEERIVRTVRETDAGGTVKDLCRRHSIASATYYQWTSKYGRLEASDLKKLRELEYENARPKQMYADVALDDGSLKDSIHRKP